MSETKKPKLFISPPFGNYVTFLPFTIPIRGSFTLEPRPGLLGRLRTIYWSKEDNGYVNKIGLRNRGIQYAVDKVKNSFFSFLRKNDVVSVAIMEYEQIPELLEKIPDDLNLEINISCPNTEHEMNKKDIQKFLNPERKFCSLKCSPHTTEDEIDEYYNMGFRTFHFSNTIKHSNGGLSGPSLRPFTSNLTKYTREKYGENVHIIAGGGILSKDDINKYLQDGCNDISVSTLLFNPFNFLKFYFDYLKM